MTFHKFTLSGSREFQNKHNKFYPDVRIISSVQELLEVACYDHIAGTFTNNERNNNNFISADCIIMDIDNDYTDDPAKWITPEHVHEKLPGIEFYTI